MEQSGARNELAGAACDGDGLLADASVQQLVRDATAAAAAASRRPSARPSPGAGPAAPSLPRREETNACPLTGYLGPEGEARMMSASQDYPDRKWFTCLAFMFLLILRARISHYHNSHVAGINQSVGQTDAGPESIGLDVISLVCVTLLWAALCLKCMLNINGSMRSHGQGTVIVLGTLLHMPMYAYTYLQCDNVWATRVDYMLRMPNPVLCTMTASGANTLRLSPLIMFFTTAFFASSCYQRGHLRFKDKLACCVGSQILIMLPHAYFAVPEVALVILKLLAFLMVSTLTRLYVIERQLRVLFLIETDMEFEKQRHFFSMQGQLAGKLSRVANISRYLKTIPFDPLVIRAGTAQMKKDNKMMTDESHALKAQLTAENGQLAPITVDCKSASCPFQGWGLSKTQNHLLDVLYTLKPPQQTKKRREVPDAEFPNQNVSQASPKPSPDESGRMARLDTPIALLVSHFLMYSPGVGLAFCYAYSTHNLLQGFLGTIIATICLIVFITRSGLYLQNAERMSLPARQFGTFLVLASSCVPLVVLITVVRQWNPEDLGNFQVDTQYLYTLVVLSWRFGGNRIHLQTQNCDLSWRFVFVYNYAVAFVSLLLFVSRLWGHPCLWSVLGCGLVMMCANAMANYDNEKLMRKCFLAERMNKQVQADAFYTVMHDVNQPLNGIANCCDLLLNCSEAETADVLNLLLVSVSWQEQLLGSGRMQEQLLFGNTTYKPSYCEHVNIQQLLEECLTIGRGYYFGGGLPIKLKCEVTAEVPSAVSSLDAQGVKRFILNLLSNAFKFTLDGSITITVTTYTTQSDKAPWCFEKGLCFSVTDTGSGIPKDKVNLLFRKFSQLHDENKGGTGLGLWSMQKMVQAMNGNCGYTPNQPTGSNFWFRVPCSSALMETPLNRNRAQPETVDPVPRTAANQQATGQQLVTKALFVDDDRLAYFVVSRMFRRMGIELEGAFDGATGLSVLKASTAQCFSCVFMDLMMPRMGGDEAIKQFRQWESINRVGQRRQAICVLSGSDQFTSQFQQLGADFMLSKPCEASRMKSIIEQVIGDAAWPNVMPLSAGQVCPPTETLFMPPPFVSAELELRATPLHQQESQRPSTKRKAAGPAQQAGEVVKVTGARTRSKAAKIMA